MSKLENMLNVNNLMDRSFAQSYQILCEFHYSNQAIHYFVHQGMPPSNNSVVIGEKNLLYSKLLKKHHPKKNKIVRTTSKDIPVYYMVQIISLHVIYCYYIKLLSSLMDCL